ncbi:dTDP-4-dehydrorhamnose 3,5-epimerase family protein [Nostoc sp. NIES-2111]
MDLDRTLAAAVKDQQTTDSQRQQFVALPEGASFFDSVCHRDDRGSVTELYDPRWNWHPEPLVFAYMFTIRPGKIKGWGLHRIHEDRYFVVRGEMEVVMYDPRPDSPTFGKVSKVYLSAARPRLMNVPRNVWHADHNIGTEDVMAVNFPTIQYDHRNPDKYRLPLDTDLIPHTFGTSQGW